MHRENRATDKLQSQYCCGFLFQGEGKFFTAVSHLAQHFGKAQSLGRPLPGLVEQLFKWPAGLDDRPPWRIKTVHSLKHLHWGKKHMNTEWNRESNNLCLPDLIWGGAVICTFPEFITTLLQAGIKKLSSGFKQHPSNITAKSRKVLSFTKIRNNKESFTFFYYFKSVFKNESGAHITLKQVFLIIIPSRCVNLSFKCLISNILHINISKIKNVPCEYILEK